MNPIAKADMISTHSGRELRLLRSRIAAPSLVLFLVSLLVAAAVFSALASAAGAAGLSVTPNTNDVVGLKSNDPTNAAFPNTFPLGAKVCNTTGAAITDVTAAVSWGAATGAGATNISVPGPTSVDLGTLNPGACLDAYYTLSITRAAASFDSTRVYTITATGSDGASGTSPSGHQIYVDKLISQNRNNTKKIAGPGGCNLDMTVCDPAPTNLVVGNDYTFKLYGDTSTSQNTVEAFLDFPDTIFRVVSATSTASLVTGAAQSIVPGVFNDACQLQWNYTLANYKGCGTAGGAGGNYAMTYRVRIIGAGSGTLKAIIYDGSSGNWHMNSDYGSAGFTSSFVARWPLNASVSGAGNVTSSPAGIDCGETGAICAGAFANGTTVTLTAVRGSDEEFIGWSGACSGTQLTCTVTMNQARSVNATFTGVGRSPLSVSVSGFGTVSSNDSGILNCATASGICSHAYLPESEVTLTATPAANQSFAGWSGGGCTGLSTTCTISVNEATQVSAKFAPNSADTFAMGIQVAGSGVVTSSIGGVNCSDSCESEFVSGASVTLTATGQSGYEFAGWSGGSCSGTTQTCTVTMDRVRFVTATFAVAHTLEVSRSGSGTGTVTSDPEGISCGTVCQGEFAGDSVVVLSATPSDGSRFDGWSGAGCDGTETCVVTMSDAQSVTATFTAITQVTVEKSGSGSGVVTSNPEGIYCGAVCSSQFDAETSVTLTAEAANGSVFTGWSGGGCGGTESCVVEAGTAATVTAEFLEPPFPSHFDLITGSPYVGRTLTAADPGPWSGSQPITITYQWQRCDGEGGECWDIEGADSTEYLLTDDDAGYLVRIVVDGVNRAGSVTLYTSARAISYGTPDPTSPPVISGTTLEGETLTATDGEWDGSAPFEFSYQWQRCDEEGAECVDIEGATSNSLELTVADINHTMRIVVTATNSTGSATQSSVQTDLVYGRGPVNTRTPEISGDPVEGQLLTGESGDWTGTEPIEYAYQWLRCDTESEECQEIEGATASTYTATGEDGGKRLRLKVTASNIVGSYAVMSALIGPVEVLPPGLDAPPEITGPTIEGETLTTDNGSWTGVGPYTYTYQWQRCDSEVTECIDIEGADEQSYLLTPDDVGHKMVAVVTATNAGGPSSASAHPVGPVRAKDPIAVNDPTISGTPTYRETLSFDDEEWSSPSHVTLSRVWLRCDVDGDDCSPIEGAVASTYILAAADVTKYICGLVTATNETGATTMQTNCIGPIAGLPPENLHLPETSGGDTIGSAVAVDTGEWDSYQSPPEYGYQWLRCDAAGDDCVEIDEATSSQYTLVEADLGHTLRPRVTATNDTGEASEQSAAPVGPIADAPQAVTLDADSVTSTGARLNATVNSRFAATTYHFEWNAEGGADHATADGSVGAAQSSDTSVSAELDELAPATTYRFRVVAENRVDQVSGEYVTFTTPKLPEPPADAPAPPPAPFSVTAKPQGMAQERMGVTVWLPGAGTGTITGRVRNDRRHVGAENKRGELSKKTFRVFQQKYSAKTGGAFDFASRIRGRALQMLRERGYLRIAVTIRYTPAGGGKAEVHKQVIKLRPFAIANYALDRNRGTATTTIRTPRAGHMRVEFLLRSGGRTTEVKMLDGLNVTGGQAEYSARLSASQLKALADGRAQLLVKATLNTSKYPARMLRSRQIAY